MSAYAPVVQAGSSGGGGGDSGGATTATIATIATMIITVGNTKGGVGKTTLAVNFAIGLALRGQDVLLVDGDQQGTAISFSQIRSSKHPEAPVYTAIRLLGAEIRDQVQRMRPRYQQIVIDVGGRDSTSLRAALLVTDLLIVPTQPRSFDLWGVDDTLQLVREARSLRDFRAMAVLNGADALGQRNREALEALAAQEGLEVSPHALVRRTAYPSAADEGLSVLEHLDPSNRPGSQKAREDFTRVLEAVYPTLEWRLTA